MESDSYYKMGDSLQAESFEAREFSISIYVFFFIHTSFSLKPTLTHSILMLREP